MLIDAELGSLGDLLSNTKDGMHTKGVDSVRSPVRNLRHFTPDISHEAFVKSVAREFTIVYGGDGKINLIDEDELHRAEIRNGRSELKSWEWSHGQTPEFTHDLKKTFSWGEVRVHMKSKHGVILSCDMQCESRVGAKDISEVCSQLEKDLVGRKYGILCLNEGTDIRRDVVEWLRDDM